MIKSFSSCLPGSKQTTSWVQSKTCDFIANFSVSVEGPLNYTITSTATHYEIDSQNNLDLYLQTGKTYTFTFNCTNDPVVIFTSGALPVPYTTEVNSYDSNYFINKDVEPTSPYIFTIPLPLATPHVVTLTPTLPFYPISGTVDVDVLGVITGFGTSFLTELVGGPLQVGGSGGYTVVGITNNTLAQLTPLTGLPVFGQILYIPGGPPLLRGTIDINIQSRINGGGWANRINNRCSVPGGPVEFRINYLASGKYLLSPYNLITYNIVGVGTGVIGTLTGTFSASAGGNLIDFTINQITGTNQAFTIEFRDSSGTLFHTTATCTIYANTYNAALAMTYYWDPLDLEVNRLSTSFGGAAYRLTNLTDFTVTGNIINFLNLYYQPPTNYRFQVLTIQYILPLLLNPTVWDIYLIDLATNNQIKQTLNVDYDIIGTSFYWNRTKTFPLSSGFTAIPMIGQQGEATWLPTIPGIYSYKSYTNPSTHFGKITVTNGPYIVPPNSLFSIKKRLTVTAEFTAPTTYLDFDVYTYQLCDLTSTFAVVTKNNYNPLILLKDRLSRWYNYYNENPTFSFATVVEATVEPTVAHDYLVHYGVGTPDLENDLIFLNHIESHINFYGGVLKRLVTIKSPTSMIHYERIKYTLASVVYNEILFLGIDGKIYKLTKDLTFVSSSFVFFPTIPPTAPSILGSDMLGENQFGLVAWPSTKATPIFNILFPLVKGFCVSPTRIYIIGGPVVRVSDYNFNVLADVTVPEPINAIAWFYDSYVIVTTEFHNYYLVNTEAPFNFKKLAAPFATNADTVIGHPAQLSVGTVLVPFSHEKRIVVISNSAPPVAINLVTYGIDDFISFYARNFDNVVFITGHDTNKVLTIDKNLSIKSVEFTDKVTTVDVNNGQMLVSHYMKSKQTLDLSNIIKVMPFSVGEKQGAGTFISSDPKKIKLLGKELISCTPGPYTSWWTNGTHQQLLRTDDYFSISYRGSFNGVANTFIIIGETAIDFTANVFDNSNKMIDYFDPAPPNGINVINTTYTYVQPSDVLGEFPLPYELNFFGKKYGNIYTTYNGIVGLDPSFSYNTKTPSTFFTPPLVDALVLEPIEGWPGYPIDNSDVTDIKYGTLVGNVIPGVYYENGFIQTFAYYKFKYVGTLASTIPNGNVRITNDIPQTGLSFNFKSTTSVLPGQTVSNKITSPPLEPITFTNILAYPASKKVTVTNVYTHSSTAQAYSAPVGGNLIYLSSSLVGLTKKYANISSAGASKFHGYVDSALDDSKFGNLITNVDPIACRVTMLGLHNGGIGLDWVFDFVNEAQTRFINLTPPIPAVTTTLASSTLPPIFRVQNITNDSYSFFSLNNDTNANVLLVSNVIYNKVSKGQVLSSTLFSLNGGYEIVTDKWILKREISARLYPQSIRWSSASDKRLYIMVGKDNLPDGLVCTFQLIGPDLTELVLPAQIRYFTPSPPNQPKLKSTKPPVSSGATYRPTEFKNTSDGTATYNATSSTFTFTFALYGDATEINIDTNYFTPPYTPKNGGAWKFKITSTYKGTPIEFNFPVGSTSFFSYGSSFVRGYIPGSGPLFFADLNEYSIGLHKDKSIYNIADNVIVSSTFSTYQFYPSAAVSALLSTMTPTYTIAVANTGLDITETVSETRINYKLHLLTSVNMVKDVITTTNNALTTITMGGKFIDLDHAQTLPTNTELLFKHVYPHPVTEYEFGIYWGKNFQFIEYNHTSNHIPLLAKGITSIGGFNESYSAPALAPGDYYSYVWASSASNGIFQSVNKPPDIFGNGVFMPISLAANLRSPRIWQVDVNRDNVLRYDLIVDNNFTATMNVKCSIEYGKIFVNDLVYDGSTPILENDIISFYFYFADNNKPWTLNKNPQPRALAAFTSSYASSTVVFSLGSTQYNVAIAPEIIYKSTPIRIIDVNYPKQQNITEYVLIAVTGRYHLPNNYISATGIGAELFFTRQSSGFNYILAAAQYHYLTAGDVLRIDNIFTSSKDNDIKELIISGPEIIKLRIHTPNVYALVDYFTLTLTSQPFTQLTRPTTLVLQGPGYKFLDDTVNVEVIGSTTSATAVMPPNWPKTLDDELPFFVTSPIQLTSSLGSTSQVSLFVDTFGTGFNLNGNSTSNNSILVSTYSDNIAVEWNIKSYLDTRAVVYQIEKDLVDGSNVYLEVGEVLINKRTINPIVKTQPKEIVNSLDFTNQSINNAVMFFDINIEVIANQSDKTIKNAHSLQLPANFGTSKNQVKLLEKYSYFPIDNQLQILSYNNFFVPSMSLFKNNFQADFYWRNDLFFKQPPVFFTVLNQIQKLQFSTIVDKVGNKTINFTNFFNKNSEKFYLAATTFLDQVGTGTIKNNFSLDTTDPALDKAATMFKRNVDKRYISPTEYYGSPITANSNVLNFTNIFRKNNEKLTNNPNLLFFNNLGDLLLPPSIFVKKNFENVFLAPVFFTHINNLEFTIPIYMFDKNYEKFLIVPGQISGINNEKRLLPAETFNYINQTSWSIAPETFYHTNQSSEIKFSYFVKLNAFDFLPQGETFIEIDVPTYIPSVRPYYHTNQSSYNKFATTFDQSTNPTFIPNATMFDAENIAEYKPDGTLFKKYYEADHLNFTLELSFNSSITNFLSMSKFTAMPYYMFNHIVDEIPTTFIHRQDNQHNIAIQELVIRNTNRFIKVGEQKNFPLALNIAFTEEYKRESSLHNSFLEEYKRVSTLHNSFLAEYVTFGIMPPLNDIVLANRIWLSGKLNLDLEYHGIPVPLPPELEYHGIPVPLPYEHTTNPYTVVPLPHEFEKHGWLPPFNEELLVTRPWLIVDFDPELEYHGIPIPLPPELEYHGIPIPLPPELEYHGVPIPLPPELEYHGVPVPLPVEHTSSPFLEIPLPADFEKHGWLPPFNDILFAQRLWLKGDLILDLEYHGVPVPLPPELEYHGVPIPLPPELEYHGVPIPLPPELEYHGVPVPLPPDLEYHGIPVNMPALMMKQNTNYYKFKQNWELLKEMEWNNDDPFTHGAFMTDFNIFVNEGKDSDYKGYPPFISYDQKSGSALLSKGLPYGLGSFPNPNAAAIVAAKYISAGVIQIVGTSHWNYRIFFDNKVFTPTRSMVFPRTWFIKGG